MPSFYFSSFQVLVVFLVGGQCALGARQLRGQTNRDGKSLVGTFPFNTNANDHHHGHYHSMHIRRTDLKDAYRDYDVERNASQIYEEFTVNHNIIPKDSVVYIATDEKDKHFFDVFRDNYKRVYFLDDFQELLEGIHPDYYGMIDQLIASRGEHFIGTYYSTFTGYINRLRGYHSQKTASRDDAADARKGIIPSWFYSPKGRYNVYQRYEPITISLFEMEYPIGWRNIDFDVDIELRNAIERDEQVAAAAAAVALERKMKEQ